MSGLRLRLRPSDEPGRPRGPVRAPWIAATSLLLACSTLAEVPKQEECTSDDDCSEGFVCAIDQGDCLPGNEAAPRAHLGFDIRETIGGQLRFRAEVDGCDCTIREEENIRELAVRRGEVSQQLQLAVKLPDLPEGEDLLDARFVLRQPSRFSQLPSPLETRVDHPTLVDPGDPSSVVDTVVRWPRYHPLDVGVPSPQILWSVAPVDGQALRYMGIEPPLTNAGQPCETDQDCCPAAEPDCDPSPNYCEPSAGECTSIGSPSYTFQYTYEPACSRSFQGAVVRFDLDAPAGTDPIGAPVPEANTVLRYADLEDGTRIGVPVFRDPAAAPPPPCTADDDCEADQYCDPDTQQCFVALAGRPANNGRNADTNGLFETEVYTYCDGETNTPLEPRFEIEITPPPTLPLPSVRYAVTALFLPGPDEGVFSPAYPFCVPDWGPSASVELVLDGPARTLAGDGEQVYTCCDVSCLPATADDLEEAPPPEATSCDGRTSAGSNLPIRMRTDFVVEPEQLASWAAQDKCVTPTVDLDNRAGRLERSLSCNDPETPCLFTGLSLGSAEAPRVYQVRVQTPVGSVLASGDFTIELGPDAPQQQSISLAPRALVTGFVDVDDTICARRSPSEDCAAREAIVIAERLRMPDEADDGVPGPYLHEVTTFYDPQAQRDGAFVLPLDPGGVYVITALPLAGAEGGPSRFHLVNLRSDAPEPFSGPLQLVLEDGVIVTLALEQFDQRTSVIPVDRGSFLAENRLTHPGREGSSDPFVDLNRAGECWTDSEGPEGCRIRRLIPPDTNLTRSLVGTVRFTARRSNRATCTSSCVPPSG